MRRNKARQQDLGHEPLEREPHMLASVLKAEFLQEKSGSKRVVNSTAYRIFKLLQWLIQTPLSVDALNQRFCEDPLIGKAVSNDSIWLYINTLKALGCNIRRPSPRNQFQYEMISHPFGLALTELQRDSLAQAKAFAQQSFTFEEMQTLDGLFKKVIAYTVCDNPQAEIEQLFLRSRSFDYGDLQAHIATLTQFTAERQLSRLVYLSPKHGEETFTFLPMAIFYDRGVVYIRGERPEFDHPSCLRADRILRLSPLVDDSLKNQLLSRQQLRTELTVLVFVTERQAFNGFGLDENQGVYSESLRWVGSDELTDDEKPHYEVKLQVREFFFLKQKILWGGLPCRVLGADSFREDLQRTLMTMRQFYQKPASYQPGAEGDSLG